MKSMIEHRRSSLRSFFAGVGVSVVILISFFAGALADRVFGIRPLDYLARRMGSISSVAPGSIETSSTTRLQTLLESGQNIPSIAQKASESVITVAIKQKNIPIQQQFFFFGFGGQQQLPDDQPETIQRDIGTGFVVDGGLIVTNKHVVSQVNGEYILVDKEGREYSVQNIYRDPSTDLAILRVEGMQAPALPLGNSDALQVGEGVIAIGTALGQFRHTVTTGVISGVGRGIEASSGAGMTESLEGVIQTDAAINPGNSGGPLLNMDGVVIGVNVAVSVSAQNIGFALPINVIKDSIANFEKTGQFNRPFLGVSYRMISEQAAVMNNLPQGAYLVEITPESTAATLGLEAGDVLTTINSSKLSESNDLIKIVNSLSIGDKIEVTFWRKGEALTKSGTVQGLQN
jgi:serine protease Do